MAAADTTVGSDTEEPARPPVALPPGRALELSGGTTFVRDLAGPPDAPVLFLLHGWLATADLNWHPSYEALGEHFRVIAIDHRGHGRGIKTSQRFRLADCADDVAEAGQELGVDRFTPVGYSMGGPIAQLVWHRHPESVEGLVLCATSRNFAGRPGERAAFSMIGGAAFAARATPPPVRRTARKRLAARRHDETPSGRWARDEFGRSDFRALMEAGRSLGAFSSADWIGHVDVPAAVVVTEQDQLVKPHRQHKLAAAIPGATVHPVDGDHVVCAAPDARERFVPVLVEACRSVTGRIETATPT